MNQPTHPFRIAIIGGGITGLRAAHCLARDARIHGKIELSLFDSNAECGGVLQTFKSQGFQLELAAQGVLSSRLGFARAVADLKLEQQLLWPAKKQMSRFLITANGLVRLGPFPVLFLRKGLLTAKGLFRVLGEFFLRPQNAPNLDETLFEFGSRHFGTEVAESFLVPAATGIWAGGAKRLLLRYTFPVLAKLEAAHGSLLKALLFGFLAKLFTPKSSRNSPTALVSFPQGMHHLPHSLLTATRTLLKNKQIPWHEHWSTPVAQFAFANSHFEINGQEFDAVVFTAPPWHCPGLLKASEHAEAAYARLTQIPTHSLVCVGLGGTGISNPQKGFGALAGSFSKDLLGVLFLHALYPSHVPTGNFLYRVMLGGDRDPNFADKSDAEIFEITRARLADLGLLPAAASVTFTHITRWKNTIPLAVAGHDEVLAARWKLEALCPGLYLAGNYLEGVSVADCLQSAEQAVSLLKKRIYQEFH